jgi:hypothetical protein
MEGTAQAMGAIGKSRIHGTWGRLGRGGVVLASLAGSALWATACQAPAIVRTARTLPEGAVDVSVSLYHTRLSFHAPTRDGAEVPLGSFELPNPVPDVIYAYGATDDFELGGRLSLGSGLLEVNVKYRYFESDAGTLHLALAPALGYRALGLVNGPVLTLPALATWDMSPQLALSGGPLVSYASYAVPASLEPDDADLSGDTLYAGAALGIQWRPGLGFHVMPSLELWRSLMRGGQLADTPAIHVTFLCLTLGWSSSTR